MGGCTGTYPGQAPGVLSFILLRRERPALEGQ
jgi:hypothetical protein